MTQQNNINIKDVTIIGAGPVGLFSIFQCGMLGLSTQIIDSLDDVGGQCTALYPEKPIYDIPAYPEISGGELINALTQQASAFECPRYLSQHVEEIKQDDHKNFHITTSKNNTLISRSIIIAAGAGAFGPNRPPLDTIQEYEGTSVFYYVKDISFFKNKKIVIAGGGDSAVDWTLALSGLAKHVTLIHRRDKFKAAPESVNALHKLAAENIISLKTGWQLSDIKGSAPQLDTVEIKDLNDNKQEISADCLLPFYGLSNDLSAFQDWPITINNQKIVVDPLTNQTDHTGIFAIGDVCTYPNKLNLILTGFSESALAIHKIRDYLHPEQVFHFQHSTSLKPEERNKK